MSTMLVLHVTNLCAQGTFIPDSTRNNSEKNAVKLYHNFTSSQSRLFNGREHTGYSPKLIGHAYFLDDKLSKGNLIYDNIYFDNVPMLYDLVKDQLVVQHFGSFFRINLLNEKVKEFSFLDHKFIRVVRDTANGVTLNTGFYDLLYSSPRVTMLARHSKLIEETVTDEVVIRAVQKNFYYILKDKQYVQIRTYKSLLRLLAPASKKIREHLRKSKIKFRKQKQEAILEACKQYDLYTK